MGPDYFRQQRCAHHRTALVMCAATMILVLVVVVPYFLRSGNIFLALLVVAGLGLLMSQRLIRRSVLIDERERLHLAQPDARLYSDDGS